MGDIPDGPVLETLHRQGPVEPPTIYRTECPSCGMVLTAMSQLSLSESLHTHQEACPRG